MSLRAIACLLPSVFTCLSVPFARGPFGIGSVITATRSIHVSVYSQFFFQLDAFYSATAVMQDKRESP